MRSEVRARRRQLRRIEQQVSDDDLGDWAFVHALARMDWYRAHMTATRLRFLTLETSSLLLAGGATVLAALNAQPWLTASVAATVTFLAGLRRVVSWHEDWLAFSEAWAELATLISRYRLLPQAERTQQRREELVAEVDEVVLRETRGWGRRRRELKQATMRKFGEATPSVEPVTDATMSAPGRSSSSTTSP